MRKELRLYFCGLCLSAVMAAQAQVTHFSQMEKLDRGVVALPSETGLGNFISWRFLGTDSTGVRFDLLRDGATLVSDLTVTNYDDSALDWDGAQHEYQVVTKLDGQVLDTSAPVKAWKTRFLQLKLNRPATGTANGGTYSPNDCSVGDVDGDGQYELFVKWDPSTSKDNSQSGVTDNVYIDCYRLDGTFLWRVDLGRNIRAGAHYTQFQVYDYDGDGKAELMCKTGPGSKDGQGQYVSQAATDATIKGVDDSKSWVSSDGRITGGQEYLTVFNGETGAAIHTIFYNPNRNQTYGGAADGSFNWGTPDNKNDKGTYGNRGERFLAATAYLGGPGQNPSGIFCRGYYGYAFVWAVDFDGQQLHQRWLSKHLNKTSYTLTTYDASGRGTSKTYGNCKPTHTAASGEAFFGGGTMFGNGNHNMSIADVDGDGCDEIIWGSAALNNDGMLLYGTGFGHGDAIHLAKHCPDREGYQVFQVHEDKLTYAWDLHDAATGEILLMGGPEGQDNGRGMAGNFDASVRGSLFWSASDGSARSAVSGDVISTKHGSMNFRIFWDGDPQEELLDGTNITKFNATQGTSITLGVGSSALSNMGKPHSCNSTKATPCLSADIFGDWREEVILWDGGDNATLNIYTTITPTEHRVPTLMHDHVYRMGICWQNTAYNQPPHLGYYLPDYLDGKITITGIREVSGDTPFGGQDTQAIYDLSGRRLPALQSGLNIVREGTKVKKVIVK